MQTNNFIFVREALNTFNTPTLSLPCLQMNSVFRIRPHLAVNFLVFINIL